MSYAHGGNLQELAQQAACAQESIIDFSANINPLGPPDWLRSVISRHISNLQHYPDPTCRDLIAAACERYPATTAEVLSGNGSTELLYQLVATSRKKQVCIPVPAYADYTRAAKLAGISIKDIPLSPANDFKLDGDTIETYIPADSLFIVGHPANPTGQTLDATALRELARRRPDCLFLIDEAFGDFVENFQSLTIDRPDNLAVLLSLTKLYAVPGLRLGCAIAPPDWCQRVRDQQLPWSTNTLAQAVAAAALRDAEYAARTRTFVAQQRQQLQHDLTQIPGLTLFQGKANFLLIQLAPGLPNAADLARLLLHEDSIAIRVCDNFQSLGTAWFRVAVRTPEQNALLVAALQRILTPRATRKTAHPKTPAIMFQGTSSNAGKSVLTAALCRILLQDGYRIAPFKAQNMSLNSFVTRDGAEMGRAQVVQAQACRLEPDVRMNPVLLKPNSDTGSQVIVNGHPVGNMRVQEYIRFKPKAFEAIQKAYDSLSSEYDAIILEGAGSPGEVNLKAHDIVNMTMARYAAAPVLLVGDIDRGGVFASFIGTMDVLTEAERAIVAGFIVNRFRGQESLLQDAFDYTFRHTGKAVLGTVPYLHNLHLPEEDSVSFKEQHHSQQQDNGDQKIEIAVIDLPHISNFTDLDALRIEPDVHLRTVRDPSELGSPQAVILPGSKNTLADLAWLKTSGLAAAICDLAARSRVEIIGICGGFQILGRTVADPHHIETTSGEARGLNLLDVTTTMLPEKTLLRTTALHQASGCEVTGYEIHHGQTTGTAITPLLTTQAGSTIGFASQNGRIWGTYLHGIFDADPFRRWYIDCLRERQGWQPVGRIVATYDIEAALDRLAEVVRAKLDMPAIYRTMRLP